MTVGGEASFETMREDIPGQAIVKMNASLIDLLQDGIGTYYPHMQRPLSNVLGSWQELKRTVEVATMYLGPSGQNSFLHTVVSPIISFVTIPHLTVFVSRPRGSSCVTNIRGLPPSSRRSCSVTPSLWVMVLWLPSIP